MSRAVTPQSCTQALRMTHHKKGESVYFPMVSHLHGFIESVKLLLALVFPYPHSQKRANLTMGYQFQRAVKKIAQGCQSGTRQILKLDISKNHKQKKNLAYTPCQG